VYGPVEADSVVERSVTAADLLVRVGAGEATVRWEASQASGLKLHLEAQLQAAGLPQIAIEVRHTGVPMPHLLAAQPWAQCTDVVCSYLGSHS
jgi:hypothetical protein